MMFEPIGAAMAGVMSGVSYTSYGAGINTGSKDKLTPTEQIQNSAKPAEERKKAEQEHSAVSDEHDKKRRFDSFECETCENRKYQDGSDDSGVSFQTPTKIAPEQAAAKVRGHEQEHVVRNRAKAEREGDEIVSQSVTLHTGICPECGKVYISGGTTRTTIKSGGDSDKFNVGMEDPESGKGRLLDMAV
ncbi:MAG: hypothetical protein IJO91_07340 [Oscillospiraceae bacterium]|nr:hypothetical protein [Oscillospiraceae bacterium]